jgi:hypothetical protein
MSKASLDAHVVRASLGEAEGRANQSHRLLWGTRQNDLNDKTED